mmetsp:Transcript_29477/g.46249  ORF Transcript_29477/g.46249 Transcript_29477/m.46249 type:complete len:242 (+) Transcript_29477:597-1322(+)
MTSLSLPILPLEPLPIPISRFARTSFSPLAPRCRPSERSSISRPPCPALGATSPPATRPLPGPRQRRTISLLLLLPLPLPTAVAATAAEAAAEAANPLPQPPPEAAETPPEAEEAAGQAAAAAEAETETETATETEAEAGAETEAEAEAEEGTEAEAEAGTETSPTMRSRGASSGFLRASCSSRGHSWWRWRLTGPFRSRLAGWACSPPRALMRFGSVLTIILAPLAPPSALSSTNKHKNS